MPNYDISDLTRLVASNIRGLMAQHGVKQADLAASIGVSQSQLSKMIRGVRPIDLDQLDGMCMALGEDTAAVIKRAEETLSNYETVPNARLLFVDDGIRLEEPIDTTGWGSGPVIPSHPTRASARGVDVGALSDDELRDIPLPTKRDMDLAAGNDRTTDEEDDVTP
ncbi:helix-turn-helix transcriptional regulator [Curtobacterium sp. MCBD17_003]|uniref:helix-turn-helix domain-containing protein n=1 Tax=Curtobacterium sp. MCBD17_003 TaxID=2175667 RepID=UPI000DA6FD29|nr:helix-turn-helix transcriptional regulator [Curtobacterium sp. MCBD17_003]WIE54200.1 helix-turn-helix transcriptional regulator [Curtobacterium sp. MCBD17_003]